MYYTYDKDAAIAADNSGNRITEKGKYIGTFTRAEHIVSKTGTEGIDFDFVTRDGVRARFALYTRKSDGTTTYGYKQLMALLTCLKQNGLADPQHIRARMWDVDAGKEIEKTVPQFAELLNKPIGLLIQMEEYTNSQGESKWRAGFAHAFEASTELMAAEILEKKIVPEQLPKVLLALKDRPIKESNQTNQTGSRGNSYEATKNGTAYIGSQSQTGGLADMDDDIPF